MGISKHVDDMILVKRLASDYSNKDNWVTVIETGNYISKIGDYMVMIASVKTGEIEIVPAKSLKVLTRMDVFGKSDKNETSAEAKESKVDEEFLSMLTSILGVDFLKMVNNEK